MIGCGGLITKTGVTFIISVSVCVCAESEGGERGDSVVMK